MTAVAGILIPSVGLSAVVLSLLQAGLMPEQSSRVAAPDQGWHLECA